MENAYIGLLIRENNLIPFKTGEMSSVSTWNFNLQASLLFGHAVSATDMDSKNSLNQRLCTIFVVLTTLRSLETDILNILKNIFMFLQLRGILNKKVYGNLLVF